MAIGWIFVGLGVVGAFLPIMPTVPFLLAAAFCFERGSPELHQWLIEHPKFGPPLNDWRKNRVIRWPAKILGAGGLAVSLTYTCFFSERADWVKWMVGSIGLLVIVFILTRRSRPL